jgi:putative ATPase
MDELFREDREIEAPGKTGTDGNQPLALKLAPQNLDEFFGQEKVIGEKGILRRFIDGNRLVSCIFYGPPGCGKTALAKLITRMTGSDFVRLNAVTARVEDLRAAIQRGQTNRRGGRKTILFIDEIHRFNKMQQDGLLPALEEGTVTLIGTTTKNPFFSLIPPLRSRVLLFEFERLSPADLGRILDNAARRERIGLDDEAREFLIRFANGDSRRMFNLLEAASISTGGGRIDRGVIDGVISRQPVLYDRDEDFHYDVISAFIKSVRGSDPDAALYWLALMLEGGEDPLFIARRLVILASEDIGLADSFSLVLAESAYRAVESVGMPEGRLVLAHVTLYLSLQPKSNSSYEALEKALEHVKKSETLDVPPHLRSAHPGSKDYKYPHDYKYHFVSQDYTGKRVHFFEPGELGAERELKKRLDFFKQLREKKED